MDENNEPLFTDDEITEAFKEFDKDGRGYIGVSDIKRLFQRIGIANLTDEEVSAMVDVLDIGGVGRVGFEMFKKMALLPVDELEPSRPNSPGSIADGRILQASLTAADNVIYEETDSTNLTTEKAEKMATDTLLGNEEDRNLYVVEQ